METRPSTSGGGETAIAQSAITTRKPAKIVHVRSLPVMTEALPKAEWILATFDNALIDIFLSTGNEILSSGRCQATAAAGSFPVRADFTYCGRCVARSLARRSLNLVSVRAEIDHAAEYARQNRDCAKRNATAIFDPPCECVKKSALEAERELFLGRSVPLPR
jgi:hypothetical protein